MAMGVVEWKFFVSRASQNSPTVPPDPPPQVFPTISSHPPSRPTPQEVPPSRTFHAPISPCATRPSPACTPRAHHPTWYHLPPLAPHTTHTFVGPYRPTHYPILESPRNPHCSQSPTPASSSPTPPPPASQQPASSTPTPPSPICSPSTFRLTAVSPSPRRPRPTLPLRPLSPASTLGPCGGGPPPATSFHGTPAGPPKPPPGSDACPCCPDCNICC